jgi:uncharacterized protein (DUF924 family)
MLGSVVASSDQADVLDFWFGTITDGFADDAHRSLWFAPTSQFDATIKTRFGELMRQAAQGGLADWQETPKGRLAYIILTDQFPRNVYRDSLDAYLTDHLALGAAKQGIALGADRDLTFDERCFFYLPFEHCERLVEQHTSVGLFMQLRDQTPQGSRHITGDFLRYAQSHRDTIIRFGRFPHRNQVLSRVSTTAELEYLEAGGGYGSKSQP